MKGKVINMDMNCAYCAKGELVAKFGYEVCELPARSLEERTAFIEDVVTTANAIHKVFHPDKVNYGMYGDTGHHLHMHLVPKYKDEFEWGGTFAMDPNLKKLDEAQCEEVAAKLRAEIGKA